MIPSLPQPFKRTQYVHVYVYVLSVDNRDAEIVLCQLEFFSQKPGSGPWVSVQVVHVFWKTRIYIQQFCCCCIDKQILQT
jgi:hypothetical protein